MPNRIAVISDTHNLLRNEALQVLKDADMIIHAGDICKKTVLDEIKNVAPLTVVRGNNDKEEELNHLSRYEIIDVGEISLFIIHDIHDMDIDPAAIGIDVVIFGHSHKAELYERDNVTYFNPGSAGPKRFKLPITMGILYIDKSSVHCEIIYL